MRHPRLIGRSDWLRHRPHMTDHLTAPGELGHPACRSGTNPWFDGRADERGRAGSCPNPSREREAAPPSERPGGALRRHQNRYTTKPGGRWAIVAVVAHRFWGVGSSISGDHAIAQIRLRRSGIRHGSRQQAQAGASSRTRHTQRRALRSRMQRLSGSLGRGSAHRHRASSVEQGVGARDASEPCGPAAWRTATHVLPAPPPAVAKRSADVGRMVPPASRIA